MNLITSMTCVNLYSYNYVMLCVLHIIVSTLFSSNERYIVKSRLLYHHMTIRFSILKVHV